MSDCNSNFGQFEMNILKESSVAVKSDFFGWEATVGKCCGQQEQSQNKIGFDTAWNIALVIGDVLSTRQANIGFQAEELESLKIILVGIYTPERDKF